MPAHCSPNLTTGEMPEQRYIDPKLDHVEVADPPARRGRR